MANDKFFHAIDDGTRRLILERLRAEPATVGQLAAVLSVSQPAVSQHLRVLREAGLVGVTPRGTRRIYRISGPGWLQLRAYVASFRDAVRDRFAEAGG